MPFGARRQKAVYWALHDWDRTGRPTVEEPEELDVRWEKGLSQEVTPNVNPEIVESTVWVNQAIELGSVFWKGALIDLPDSPTNLREVVDYQEIPDVKGRIYERVVLLGKYMDTLPTIETGTA